MRNYETQRIANILSFLTDVEMSEKKRTLYELIAKTESKKLVWAVGCSGAMFFDGVWDEMHDFDVVVSRESINDFVQIFKELGGKLIDDENGKEGYFDSGFFSPAILNNVEFDIISDFTVTTFNTRYCYSLEQSHIRKVKDIPIIPMEANLLLYGMMCGWQEKRKFKYQLCLEYLAQEGTMYPELLEIENLPRFITNDLKKLQ